MRAVPYSEGLRELFERRPDLANELLEGALNSLLAGELEDGRLLLRQYIKATMGFQELARRTGRRDKNLLRSLSASGNPTAANLLSIIQACVDAGNLAIAARIVPKQDSPAAGGLRQPRA